MHNSIILSIMLCVCCWRRFLNGLQTKNWMIPWASLNRLWSIVWKIERALSQHDSLFSVHLFHNRCLYLIFAVATLWSTVKCKYDQLYIIRILWHFIPVPVDAVCNASVGHKYFITETTKLPAIFHCEVIIILAHICSHQQDAWVWSP